MADDFHLDAGGGGLSRGSVVLLSLLCTLGGPALPVKDILRRHGRVGGVRDHAPKLQYGDLGSSFRMVHEVDKRSREQPGREHGHLRRRTGQDVRGGGIGTRKTIPCSPVQVPESAPTRLNQEVTFVRCVHPVASVEPSRKREALLVRNADAPGGHISQGRRTGE